MLSLSPFGRLWLKWFALILVAATALVAPFQYKYELNREDVISTQGSIHLVTAETVVNSLLKERLGDIDVLSTVPDVSRYTEDRFHGTEDLRAEVTSIFKNFCHAYGKYDQIRLIRLDGQELIRVNLAGGRCVDIPQSELQNKVDRYYFKEAVKLPSGKVFISPLDLNVEQGKVEEPYKPMIRFAAPVTDSQGKVRAVLVLNYLAKGLLGQAFRDTADDFRNHQFNFLLNGQGYYLRNEQSPNREFGFMFGRDQERFGKDRPDVWQSLSEILCVRHTMTTRSMYAKQDEVEERSHSREIGGAAQDPQRIS